MEIKFNPQPLIISIAFAIVVLSSVFAYTLNLKSHAEFIQTETVHQIKLFELSTREFQVETNAELLKIKSTSENELTKQLIRKAELNNSILELEIMIAAMKLQAIPNNPTKPTTEKNIFASIE